MSLDYAAYEHLVASVQLLLAMLGVGALLSCDDIISQFRFPKSLVVGLVLQWLVLPCLAILAGMILPVPIGIAVGFLFIAIVPTGVTGNVLTLMGKGNIALSISLTAITTVLALFTVPICLHLFVATYLPSGFSMPYTHILRDIVFYLLLPLSLGMFLRAKASEETSQRFARYCVRASLALIGLMAVGAASTGRLDPEAYGMIGIAALVIFCLLIQLAAYIVCMSLKLPAADRLAIIIKTNYRNISLAVAIKAVIFPAQAGVADPVGDAVFFTILLYGGVSLFASLTQVGIHRWLYRQQSL